MKSGVSGDVIRFARTFQNSSALFEVFSLAGMLTIVIFPIPTGVRVWIEDVVVDESGRGKGVGEALSKHASESAGAKTVDLTSRPSREAANRLNRRIGFVPRETNAYRYVIEQ